MQWNTYHFQHSYNGISNLVSLESGLNSIKVYKSTRDAKRTECQENSQKIDFTPNSELLHQRPKVHRVQGQQFPFTTQNQSQFSVKLDASRTLS